MNSPTLSSPPLSPSPLTTTSLLSSPLLSLSTTPPIYGSTDRLAAILIQSSAFPFLFLQPNQPCSRVTPTTKLVGLLSTHPRPHSSYSASSSSLFVLRVSLCPLYPTALSLPLPLIPISSNLTTTATTTPPPPPLPPLPQVIRTRSNYIPEHHIVTVRPVGLGLTGQSSAWTTQTRVLTDFFREIHFYLFISLNPILKFFPFYFSLSLT